MRESTGSISHAVGIADAFTLCQMLEPTTYGTSVVRNAFTSECFAHVGFADSAASQRCFAAVCYADLSASLTCAYWEYFGGFSISTCSFSIGRSSFVYQPEAENMPRLCG